MCCGGAAHSPVAVVADVGTCALRCWHSRPDGRLIAPEPDFIGFSQLICADGLHMDHIPGGLTCTNKDACFSQGVLLADPVIVGVSGAVLDGITQVCDVCTCVGKRLFSQKAGNPGLGMLALCNQPAVCLPASTSIVRCDITYTYGARPCALLPSSRHTRVQHQATMQAATVRTDGGGAALSRPAPAVPYAPAAPCRSLPISQSELPHHKRLDHCTLEPMSLVRPPVC